MENNMTEQGQYFYFTLGPVQGFVAQARRTRDFWAGSFVLSWLSAVAMQATKQQGGTITFPFPDDNYLNFLVGEGQGEPPQQGSIPNRFKALQAKVPQDFDANLVMKSVEIAWQALAELVWKNDIEPQVGIESISKDIWDRQVTQFWDKSWCLTEDVNASDLLDRRKNWRSYMAPVENGIKCSLMEGWQEISGQSFQKGMQQFWQDLRSSSDSINKDIHPSEQLCAIAFIKRRFMHYFNALNSQMPSSIEETKWQIKGWKLPHNVPSTAYLAAAPWLLDTINSVKEDLDIATDLKQLHSAISSYHGSHEGQNLSLKMLDKACESQNVLSISNWKWSDVSGQFLYEGAIEQWISEAKKEGDNDDVSSLTNLQGALKKVSSKTRTPSPFYALLLMDGDSLGIQMSNPAKQTAISRALNDFTKGVPACIKEHSGFLVYAGGDDVLALMPQTTALECANALRKFYSECFAEQNNQLSIDNKISTSLSGAIEFAHYKTPLTKILQDAHPLLDNIAKDKTGRDSLAIRIHKPGGLHAQWSSPWQVGDADVVNDLIQIIAKVASYDSQQFANGFFFKLESLIQQLGLDKAGHDFDIDNIQALVRSAWLHTGSKVTDIPDELNQTLLSLCEEVVRHVDDNQLASISKTGRFNTGVLKIIQFMATQNPGHITADENTMGSKA